MRAALFHGIRDIRIAEIAKPTPHKGECLIQIKAVSLCGSDLHIYSEGNVGGVTWTEPFSAGHEFAGVVCNHSTIPDGTPVIADPAITCEQCDMCSRGWQHLCRNIQFCGLPPIQGALREWITWPEQLVFPAPDGLDFAQNALIEPLAVAVHAIEQVPPPPGGRIAILGAGGIGLSILQVAKACGAAEILITDLVPERLVLAQGLGADVTVLADKNDPVAVAREWSNGLGADVVYEAAGAAETPAQAVEMVRPRGTVAIAGIPAEDSMTIRATGARRYEISMAWIRRQNHNYEAAIQLVKKGMVCLAPMLTHRFTLEEVTDAFELAISKRDGALRIAIEM